MARIHPPAALTAPLLLLLVPLAGTAASPDWDALADIGTIHVVTHDEDGEPRETKIWLAVVDGQGFIRTGGSTWGDNVERDPNLVLRIDGVEYELAAEFIEDETLRQRVTETFREKYGFTDSMIGIVRGSDPRIMHMIAR